MKFEKLAGVALGALCMQGCAMVSDLGAIGLAENIEDNAATLNAAHTRAMTAIIAVNAVRFHFARNRMFARLAGRFGAPIPEIVRAS